MKKILLIILLFCFSISFGQSDSVVFTPPTHDTFTDENNPATNYGNQANMYFGTNAAGAGHGHYVGAIKFGALINDSIPSGYTLDSVVLMAKQEAITGLCTLFVATFDSGYDELTLNFANQPDSVLTYVSDTLTAANWMTSWWRWDVTDIAIQYHYGGALEGLDTTRGFAVLDPKPGDVQSNYISMTTSEAAANEPEFVLYFSSGEETGVVRKINASVVGRKVIRGVIQPKVRAP